MGVRITHFGPAVVTDQDYAKSVFGGMDAAINPIQPAEPMGNSIRQLLNQQLPGQTQQMQAFAPQGQRPSKAVQAEMDRQEVDRMRRAYEADLRRQTLQSSLNRPAPEMPHVTNPAARPAFEQAHAFNLNQHARRQSVAQAQLAALGPGALTQQWSPSQASMVPFAQQ
jgi:hypothetical protein